MDLTELLRRLESGAITRLDAEAWEPLAGAFPLVEQHDTQMSGLLSIHSYPSGILAVESPSSRERVVRPLASADDARRFVADRLAAYDRMWDGCGVSIDYDH